MNQVSQILNELEQGDPTASEKLLPLVYNELRRLAAGMLANEKVGQTWQPTALVHEAYLRLVGSGTETSWNGRGHFFAAAAEAMRRLLIDNARRKRSLKRGGDIKRASVDPNDFAASMLDDRLLEVDDAISRLEQQFPDKAAVVKLRYFAGLTNNETAAALGISSATAQRHWTFAKVWLFSELQEEN